LFGFLGKLGLEVRVGNVRGGRSVAMLSIEGDLNQVVQMADGFFRCHS